MPATSLSDLKCPELQFHHVNSRFHLPGKRRRIFQNFFRIVLYPPFSLTICLCGRSAGQSPALPIKYRILWCPACSDPPLICTCASFAPALPQLFAIFSALNIAIKNFPRCAVITGASGGKGFLTFSDSFHRLPWLTRTLSPQTARALLQ